MLLELLQLLVGRVLLPLLLLLLPLIWMLLDPELEMELPLALWLCWLVGEKELSTDAPTLPAAPAWEEEEEEEVVVAVLVPQSRGERGVLAEDFLRAAEGKGTGYIGWACMLLLLLPEL